jgi:ATP-dependent Clp protease ATP-binding subunit ClpA
MFDRCFPTARRAIFFARYVAVMDEAAYIDSGHLLRGLMWDKDSRADALFDLREKFPFYRGYPYKVADYQTVAKIPGPPLSSQGKRNVVLAREEADALRDYWIDTEHLLLGILADPGCLAAQNLAKAHISLERARCVIREKMATRPKYPDYYGPEICEGEMPSLLDKMISKWRRRKYRTTG